MKSYRVSPLLSFLARIAVCSAPRRESSVDDVADTEALQRAVDDLLHAVNEDDLGGVLACVTHEVVLMPPDRPTMVGKAFLQSWAKNEFGRNTSDEDWFEDEVVVSGDWGWVRGDYAVSVESETDLPQERYGKQLMIFKRTEDGSWKLARAIWNITESESDLERTVGSLDPSQ